MASGTLDTPTGARAAIPQRTLRKDRWWQSPLLTMAALLAWIAYAARPGVHAEVVLGRRLPLPDAVLLALRLDRLRAGGRALRPLPAGLADPAVRGADRCRSSRLFRLTCYYYRKAYYRSFWLSPPACAVPEPHAKYTGETRFPLILQNSHRYFFYAAVVLSR